MYVKLYFHTIISQWSNLGHKENFQNHDSIFHIFQVSKNIWPNFSNQFSKNFVGMVCVLLFSYPKLRTAQADQTFNQHQERIIYLSSLAVNYLVSPFSSRATFLTSSLKSASSWTYGMATSSCWNRNKNSCLSLPCWSQLNNNNNKKKWNLTWQSVNFTGNNHEIIKTCSIKFKLEWQRF